MFLSRMKKLLQFFVALGTRGLLEHASTRELTLRRQNVNFFTFACVCAVLTMKELPQAPGTPNTPT